jgi:hypothetical protein
MRIMKTSGWNPGHYSDEPSDDADYQLNLEGSVKTQFKVKRGRKKKPDGNLEKLERFKAMA